MALFYEDLVEPTIVKQVSRQIAYCRCTRTKNLPFCDGSHAGTNISPRVLEFHRTKNYCYLPLLEIKRPSLLRRHTRPADKT